MTKELSKLFGDKLRINKLDVIIMLSLILFAIGVGIGYGGIVFIIACGTAFGLSIGFKHFEITDKLQHRIYNWMIK